MMSKKITCYPGQIHLLSGAKSLAKNTKITCYLGQNHLLTLLNSLANGIVFIDISFIKVSRISLNTIFFIGNLVYFSKSLRGK